MKINKISNCRVCNSEGIESILLLPQMPFTDEFLKKERIGKEFLADIEIGICYDCGSVQNMNNTDMDEYYNDYTYSVQSSPFAMRFMNTLAFRIKEAYFTNNEKPKVLEIGSGSGEQLLEFKKLGFDVLGIEPSNKLSDYANSIGVTTICAFFDENSEKTILAHFNKVNLVISSYTFDHIPSPRPVLENIYNILDEDGILVLEVHNLDLIQKRNEFCLFEHEHYTYLNHQTISYLLNVSGFKVISFDILNEKEKRANSLLVVAQKVKELVDPIKYNIKLETTNALTLSSNINISIKNFEAWLEENSDKKIAAYGAGGRGIMTLAAIGNYNRLAYIVDKNPKAIKICSPKTHLGVYNLDILSQQKVDIIIVFSFGYFDEIVEEVCKRFEYNKSQFISILDILNNNFLNQKIVV